MKTTITLALIASASFLFYNCGNAPADATASYDTTAAAQGNYNGYASQKEWGKHLVIVGGCGDCHTPKKMTAQGPVNDSTRVLAGCLSPAPLPPATPEQVAKGMAATIDETAWIGLWGKSFAANITSDSTGIGNWSEQQFINCLRKGTYKGLDHTRPLMPPMPWQDYSQMSDIEIKAIFAYLKSTPPVKNVAPQYEPPVMAKK